MAAMKLVAYILVIVGALNWGLWGIAQFDLVAAIFGGSTTMLARVVYTLVGLAAVVSVALVMAGDKEPAGAYAKA